MNTTLESTHKTIRLPIDCWKYLTELKHAIEKQTGMRITYSNVIYVMKRRFTPQQMCDLLTVSISNKITGDK